MVFWRKDGPLVDGEQVKVAGKVIATDLVDAPLSGKRCAAWTTTIKVPTPREGPLLTRVLLYPVRDGIDAVRAMGSQTHTIAGPIALVSRHAGTRFELDTKRGKLRIDARDIAVAGPPLVIIPRELEREAALLADWELAGTYPTGRSYPEPAFEEIIVEPGATIDVSGVYRDGALEQPTIKTRR
jgi:hypothetical protein